MSRCFPFPPPGYEKKTRTDDVDLLIKDKHKEKKHKKEKDKNKDGKDKKDKERSKDKDREKKERKEKHKDKKKSKDKKKTDEKKVDGQPESSNGGKHFENNQEAEAFTDTKKIDGKPESSNGGKHCENNQKAQVFKDTQILEINRRITDEERGRRNQMVENPLARNPVKEDGVIRLGEKYYDSRVPGKEKIQDKDGLDKKYDIRKLYAEGGVTGNTVVPNFTGVEQKRVGGTPRRPMEIEGGVTGNTLVPNSTGVEQKRVGSTPRRPMEIEVGVTGNTVVPNFTGVEQNRVGGTPRRPMEIEGGVLGNTVVPSFTGVELKRVGGTPRRPMEIEGGVIGNTVVPSFTGVELKRVGGTPRSMEIEGGVIGNTVVPSFTGVEQKRVGGTPRPMETEKAVEQKMEGKERNKDPKSNVKQEGKHKHRDGEKRIKEKKVKELEKIKEKGKHENRKQDTMVKSPNDHINTLNIMPVQIPTHSEQSGNLEENLRKRKDCETNGLLHDNVLPSKKPRPAFPSLPIGMNGRKPEQSQAAPQLASAMHRGINSIRFDTKALKANGLIKAQPTSTTPTNSVIPPVHARENGEASKKPPHPDSKYLSTILSVPKMDDPSDFDDQEWLFGSDSLQAKKPKTVSSEIDGSTQVWDRALRIDSADVCALPYVIPY